MHLTLVKNMIFDSSDPFDGRPWAASKKVEGCEIDEIFSWAKESGIDILCQGVIELPAISHECLDWFSIWSFNNTDDQLLFVLKFGFEIIVDTA
jgi:hypothetical protein